MCAWGFAWKVRRQRRYRLHANAARGLAGLSFRLCGVAWHIAEQEEYPLHPRATGGTRRAPPQTPIELEV